MGPFLGRSQASCRHRRVNRHSVLPVLFMNRGAVQRNTRNCQKPPGVASLGLDVPTRWVAWRKWTVHKCSTQGHQGTPPCLVRPQWLGWPLPVAAPPSLLLSLGPLPRTLVVGPTQDHTNDAANRPPAWVNACPSLGVTARLGFHRSGDGPLPSDPSLQKENRPGTANQALGVPGLVLAARPPLSC